MEYGSYLNRFFAFIIDSVIISLFISLIWFLYNLKIPNNHIQFGNFIIFNVPIIGWIIGIFYYGIMESSSKQSSIGKRIMRLKVCSSNGDKISLIRSMTRNANKFLSSFFLLLGYVFIFTSKKNQALHDWLSDVVVVKS